MDALGKPVLYICKYLVHTRSNSFTLETTRSVNVCNSFFCSSTCCRSFPPTRLGEAMFVTHPLIHVLIQGTGGACGGNTWYRGSKNRIIFLVLKVRHTFGTVSTDDVREREKKHGWLMLFCFSFGVNRDTNICSMHAFFSSCSCSLDDKIQQQSCYCTGRAYDADAVSCLPLYVRACPVEKNRFLCSID